jgi:hypothetical protein
MERKPVALANMRVSNDNYKRGLEAPTSIGLSRDLIAFASSALDNSSPVVSSLGLKAVPAVFTCLISNF